jgi:hypothetical protein
MADENRKFELELEAIQNMKLKPRQKRDLPSQATTPGQQSLPLKPGTSFSRDVIERLIAWFKED